MVVSLFTMSEEQAALAVDVTEAVPASKTTHVRRQGQKDGKHNARSP